jgi:hypothetical protein
MIGWDRVGSFNMSDGDEQDGSVGEVLRSGEWYIKVDQI